MLFARHVMTPEEIYLENVTCIDEGHLTIRLRGPRLSSRVSFERRTIAVRTSCGEIT